MDKKYVKLFEELARTTAVSAETVMEYDRQKKDEKGLETATIMRDDYQSLTDTITEAGDTYVPNKAEAAKLLVGAMIMVNQLGDKITNLKNAIAGYQTDLIPKLQLMVDAENDDAAKQIAEEKFIIKEEN